MLKYVFRKSKMNPGKCHRASRSRMPRHLSIIILLRLDKLTALSFYTVFPKLLSVNAL